MKTSDLVLTISIILIFVFLYLINILGVGIKNIQDNWPLYRCNPIIMPFAGIFGQDVTLNFSYCIQNMQKSSMGELLKPVHYNMGVMGNIGSEITNSIQAVRAFFDKIRSSITNIVQEIMSVFLNLLIEIQRLIINIKDTFAKLIGILASLLHILSGTFMTMDATWSGPPGQLVKGLCFHPDTLIKKFDGTIIKMKDIKSGEILKNGQVVHATMNIHNLDQYDNIIENLYALPNGEKNKSVLVTGSHLIFDKSISDFIYVKDYYDATKVSTKSSSLVCLITSDHTIPLGSHIFHDWEDNNEIIKKK